jgi:CHAT domain-containing protein
MNAVGDSTKRNIPTDDYMQNEIGDTIISYLRSNTKYLPWTKLEVDSIKDILLHNTRYFDVMLFQGEKGTEESFKSFSGSSASIIHIATHGFNIHPPRENMRWYDYYVYCMEHTGLLLSGALDKYDNKDVLRTEDGFLRSSEISTLDLSKTDLLVLSACKSGLSGQTPIGNAGLLRAFKAAGVGTILMTLDDIDDAATCQMMVAFYKYLSNGYTKREAFKKSRQELRESDLFNNFNYWGNFVLID